VQRRPVLSFVSFTFIFSYFVGVPVQVALGSFGFNKGIAAFYLGRFFVVAGPAVAALLVIALTGSPSQVKDWLRRRLGGRISPTYFLFPALAFAITTIGYVCSGGSLELLLYLFQKYPGLFLVHLALQVLTIGLLEELGWRGWLLPRIEQGRSRFLATLWVGGIWAVWHLPVLFSGLKNAAAFVVIVFNVSLLLTEIWRRSKGGIWGVAIAHGSLNAPFSFYEALLGEEKAMAAWPYVATGYFIVAGLILAANHRHFFSGATPVKWR
jgi:membrane protease YdiL (CAAX protease family)